MDLGGPISSTHNLYIQYKTVDITDSDKNGDKIILSPQNADHVKTNFLNSGHIVIYPVINGQIMIFDSFNYGLSVNYAISSNLRKIFENFISDFSNQKYKDL